MGASGKFYSAGYSISGGEMVATMDGRGFATSTDDIRAIQTFGEAVMLFTGGSFVTTRFFRKNILSIGTTNQGYVITIGNKIKYVGKRESTSGIRYGYNRSFKIFKNGEWKHWKDF
ncbi:hypothetical protein BH23BAC3_BH23BAC3_09550 [soil metagenome]